MSLGTRLKNERDKRNWSQVYVAKRVGITNAVLSNYERDIRDPDTDTLGRLADLYEVTTDYLLGRTDNPYSTEEEDFQSFINDPGLERWYKELPKNKEEDLQRLRKMWEIFKEEE